MEYNTPSLERKTIRKVTRRIVPFMFFLYIISYLDRANIGYAALEMNKALGLTSEVFGIVSGIFFLGYFIFEVPSNMLIQRYGARVGIARILIIWGIFSVITAFAQNAMQLYIIRFLLGVAEAGFYPGIILYFTYWFRAKEKASTIALFSTAVPLSYVIGAPFSTWVMDHVHWMGMSGWRWMLVLEGLPAVILGIVAFYCLTERPEDAKWLTNEEKNWLLSELKREDEAKNQGNSKHHGHLKALTDPKVWYLSIIYFVYLTGNLGIGYWMPQIIKGLSSYLSNTQVGLITTIPYIVATVAMVYWSRRSDRKGERRMHSALPIIVAAITLMGAGMTTNPFLSIFLLTISLAGMYAFRGPFWSMPTMILTQSTAAVGIAVINSIGNLGGFVGPYAIGMLKDATGNTKTGLIFLSVMLVIAFVLLLFSQKKKNETAEKGFQTSLKTEAK